jgi:hypothetical protein
VTLITVDATVGSSAGEAPSGASCSVVGAVGTSGGGIRVVVLVEQSLDLGLDLLHGD